MMTSAKTALEWFKEAERCYLENHQGCAWCGGAHRVFHFRRGPKHIYHCNGCDFRAEHDSETGQHFIVPGEKGASAEKKTMYEF